MERFMNEIDGEEFYEFVSRYKGDVRFLRKEMFFASKNVSESALQYIERLRVGYRKSVHKYRLRQTAKSLNQAYNEGEFDEEV